MMTREWDEDLETIRQRREASVRNVEKAIDIARDIATRKLPDASDDGVVHLAGLILREWGYDYMGDGLIGIRDAVNSR